MSDAVLTPMDAVKQKMQLGSIQYNGVIDCIRRTYRCAGLWRGFYAGYVTTLVMNVPYSGVYFASYEVFKKMLVAGEEETPLVYCVAGGGAGICSAAFTNPLDVARTRLQTQQDSGRQYKGMADAMSSIWREEGWRGMRAGIKARMLFHSMAASICWFTYESVKKFLQ
jgi:solute carrier family 25 iron transporter 28/37